MSFVPYCRASLLLTLLMAAQVSAQGAGTTADVSLHVEHVSFLPGDVEVVRLRMSNPGSLAVESRVAQTVCREFTSGLLALAPFSFDLEFEGACPRLQDPGCTTFGGYNLESFLFQLGPAPAHGEASCLVRLRKRFAQDVTSPGPVRIEFVDQVMLPGGGTAIDPNHGNDVGYLDFGKTGPTVPCRDCEDLHIVTAPASGIWRNPHAPGTGLMLQVQHGLVMGAYFGYGVDGTTLWYSFNGQLHRVPDAPHLLRVNALLERLDGGTCVGCPYRAPQIFRDVGDITLEFDQRNHGWFSINGGVRTSIIPLVAGIATSAEYGGDAVVQYAAPDLSGAWVLAIHDSRLAAVHAHAASAVRLAKASSVGVDYDILADVTASSPPRLVGSVRCTAPPVGISADPKPVCSISLTPDLLRIASTIEWETLPLPLANIGDNRVIGVHPASGIRVDLLRLDYD